MTAHELARELLAGPDLPVRLSDRDNNVVEVDGAAITTCTGWNCGRYDPYVIIMEGDEVTEEIKDRDKFNPDGWRGNRA